MIEQETGLGAGTSTETDQLYPAPELTRDFSTALMQDAHFRARDVILGERARHGAIARIGRVGTAGPFPGVTEDLGKLRRPMVSKCGAALTRRFVSSSPRRRRMRRG